MNNGQLTDNLLDFFSSFKSQTGENRFIAELLENGLTIKEEDKKGKNEVHFKNGTFIKLSTIVVGGKFEPFFEHKILRMICDGIFLVQVQERLVLGVVELKKNLNSNLRKALQQIEGSYLKTTMLLSLLLNIQDIEFVAFVGGNLEQVQDDSEIDYLEMVGEMSNRPDKVESTLKQLSFRQKAQLDFPFFIEGKIHHHFQKKGTRVYHLKSGEEFDVQTL